MKFIVIIITTTICQNLASVIFWSTSSHAQRASAYLSHFQALSSLSEYCLTEHFTAACHGSGEVIVMTSALYGRMRTGRCVREDYNLGCSSDVLGHFDEQCSGQSSCKVSVRSLVDVKPCQRDFASYLEASFQCLTVMSDRHKQCTRKQSRGTEVVQMNDDDDNDDDDDDDDDECYYVLEVKPGQRVQLGLIILSGRDLTEQSNRVDCAKVFVSELTQVTNSTQPEEFEFNSCPRKHQRQRVIFTSVGNKIQVRIKTFHKHSNNQFSLKKEFSTNSGNIVKSQKFLISYKIVGCPLLDISASHWVSFMPSRDKSSTDVMIRCNDTHETWYLSCQGNQWIGEYSNCTQENFRQESSAAKGDDGDEDEKRKLTKHVVARGLLAALGLGLFIGVSIAILSLGVIFAIRKMSDRCASHEKWWQHKPTATNFNQSESSATPGEEPPETLNYHPVLRCVSHLTPPPCLSYPHTIGRTCALHCGQPIGLDYLNSNPRLSANEQDHFEFD